MDLKTYKILIFKIKLRLKKRNINHLLKGYLACSGLESRKRHGSLDIAISKRGTHQVINMRVLKVLETWATMAVRCLIYSRPILSLTTMRSREKWRASAGNWLWERKMKKWAKKIRISKVRLSAATCMTMDRSKMRQNREQIVTLCM